MGVIPSSGATSAGFCSSTSVCHSTSCQRSGQRGEGPGGGGALEALDGGVAERHARVERREVVGRVQARRGADPVDVQPAYGGQQVGAEGQVGPAAALQDAEHLGERLGDEVVDVGAGHQLASEAPGGLDVAGEELAVRRDVARRERPRSARRRCARRGSRRRGPRRLNARARKRRRRISCESRHGSDVGRRPIPGRPEPRGSHRGLERDAQAEHDHGRSRSRAGTVLGAAGGVAAALRGSGGSPCFGIGLGRRLRGRSAACSPATASRSPRPSTTSPPPRAWSAATEPAHAELRALAVAWSDATLGYVHGLSCADPLTGLASLAHLRTCIGDRYRAGAGRRDPRTGRRGRRRARDAEQLGDPLARAMEDAQLGATVRGVFPGRETIGHIAPGRLVVLADRDERLGRRVDLLLRMLESGTAAATPGLDRGPARHRRRRRRAARRAHPRLSPLPSRVARMCGRYASSRRPEDLVDEFDIVESRDPGRPRGRLQRGAHQRGVRRRRAAALARTARSRRERQLRVLTWGLIPSWAKDAVDRQPDDQRPDGDGRREAGVQAGLREAALPAPGRRLLRVVPDRGADQGGQAAQAAVLHPAAGPRRAGDGRALRDLARPRPRPTTTPTGSAGPAR